VIEVMPQIDGQEKQVFLLAKVNQKWVNLTSEPRA
jgi:hypothetical protein